jgi:hypothetical protein
MGWNPSWEGDTQFVKKFTVIYKPEASLLRLQELATNPYPEIGKGKVVPVLFSFNWAPRYEGVSGSGGIAPNILWPRH